MHPAKDGFSALPFFDEFDLSSVDILLISQYVKYILPPPNCFIYSAANALIMREVRRDVLTEIMETTDGFTTKSQIKAPGGVGSLFSSDLGSVIRYFLDVYQKSNAMCFVSSAYALLYLATSSCTCCALTAT